MMKLRIPENIKNKLSRYQFEISHIIIIFLVLITFQIVMIAIQKSTLSNFLRDTQSWFQKYYAERMALVATTNVEMLFENQQRQKFYPEKTDATMVYALNVIMKQQLIHRSVDDICLFLVKGDDIYIVDSGQKLSSFLNNTLSPANLTIEEQHNSGLRFFASVKEEMQKQEKIMSIVTNEKTFDVIVPFVPDGEYLGVLYMRITPDFTFLTSEIQASFDKAFFIFSILILFGLIGIFIVSSRAVQERNRVQLELFREHEENLERQIRLEKESLFTKRIYHTHHKAEKIMGFIKDDVRKMNAHNLNELKHRVITYSNFISRIIYDMKWYDQDINTIINPMFRTNINAIIEFIVKHVFLRISSKNEMFEFKLNLDPALPIVHVNEFTVWEILEPLIQNSIDHCGVSFVTISLVTRYDKQSDISYIIIEDNGKGITPELLEKDSRGIKKLFLELETTKKQVGVHSGYGCYIAHQLAVGKCGWELDAENLNPQGCRFTITIKN